MTPVNFDLLNREETERKLFILAKNRANLSISFINDERISNNSVISVKRLDGKIDVLLGHEYLGQDILKYLNQTCYLHFIVGHISYFTEALVTEVKEDCFSVSIKNNVYRIERRSSERLLLYPHYDAYIFFKKNYMQQYKENEDSNLIHFDKKKREQHAKEVLVNKLKISAYLGDKSLEYFSYRCLDISEFGISFLVPAACEIGDNNKNEMSDFLIGITDGKLFEIELAKIISKTSFVDNSLTKNMYKVNLEFNEISDSLKKFVNVRTESSFKKIDFAEDVITLVNKF